LLIAAKPKNDLWFDLIGFILSFCMFIGICKIKEIFQEHNCAEKQIKLLLEEKEIVLREVHHRIKNNMLTMGILLENQAEDFNDPKVRSAFADARSRVEAMSVLYDKLYRSPTQSSVSAQEYLEDLAREILTLIPGGDRIYLRVETDNIELKAGYSFFLGIIINELLTNSVKHAFAGVGQPRIEIGLHTQESQLRLSVEDNGTGLPKDFDFDSVKGFGLSLIKNLAKQLEGTFKVSVETGTRWELVFHEPTLRCGA
jgi:two-component sensor histidine kinase